MRTGEAHPLNALDSAGRSQESGEGAPIAEADAVGIDVLPQQGHFNDPVGGDRLDLGQNVPGSAVALPAAQRGHDAEGARVVAAHGDRHPRGVGGLAAGRQGGGEDLEGLLELDGGLGVVPGPLEQSGQDVEVVGAEDDVDPRGPFDDAPPHLLSQAAGHRDLHTGPLALDGGELAEVAEQTGRRVLPHGAGVDDDDVGTAVARLSGARDGGGHLLGAPIAGALEETGHVLGVVDVHLTAEGAHVVGSRSGHRVAGGERHLGHRHRTAV